MPAAELIKTFEANVNSFKAAAPVVEMNPKCCGF
jgi:hypothetical protein